MLKLVTESVEDVPTRLGSAFSSGSAKAGWAPLVRRVAIKLARSADSLTRIATAASMLHPVFDNAEGHYATAESHALGGRDEDALRTLARASELGFYDVERLEHDLAFAKLRGRAEFATMRNRAPATTLP